METNHIFYTFKIYCHKQKIETLFTENHFNRQCMQGCPHFAGTAQGQGIECLFDDGMDAPIDIIRQDTQVPALRKQMYALMAKEATEEE